MVSPRFTLPVLAVALLLLGVPTRAGALSPSKAAPVNPGSDRAYTHTARAVPFIADNYPRALAEARARKVPIFIEAWAPW